MASHPKSEVWVIVNQIKRNGWVTYLALDLWFGTKEKAEAYMSRHNMPNPRYRPVRLREND